MKPPKIVVPPSPYPCCAEGTCPQHQQFGEWNQGDLYNGRKMFIARPGKNHTLEQMEARQ